MYISKAMPPTRRYICSFCAKSFSRSEHKSRHERSHTNEKPFSCSICFAKFVRRDLLQRHLRTVHNELNPSRLINTTPLAEEEEKPEPLPEKVAATAPEPEAPAAVVADQNAEPDLMSSSIISSNFYSLSERNLILLLTLSKKFSELGLKDGKLVLLNNEHHLNYMKNENPIITSSKILNYLLIWGTISNIKFPVILNLNKILTVSSIPENPSYNPSNVYNTVYNSSIFYAVLAFGAAEYGQFSDCIKLFNTCWSLVAEKMNSPDEIIEPLTILAYISFNYLQELYYYKDQDQYGSFKTVSIHTIFQCLNDVISVLTSKKSNPKPGKSHGSASLSTINFYKQRGMPVPPELMEAVPPTAAAGAENELFNYWYAYNLLSAYSLNFCKSAPKIHRLFLLKVLPTNNDYHLMSSEPQVTTKAGGIDDKKIDFLPNETLKEALLSLTRSPTLLKNLVANTNNINSLTNAIFPTNTFKNLTLREHCIIMGLSNELQCLRLSESNLFNNNKNFLHNAIIMANKSLNTNSNYQQFNSGALSSNSPKSNEQYSLQSNSPYSVHASDASQVKYSRNVSSFGSKSHGVHSPNEPNLNIVNNTTINSNSNYLFNVNNFSNMIVNNNINQDLINVYNLIIILKKKILINCDNKLIQDLLIDYIIIPNHEVYWNLLYITIKEFTFINSDFTQWNELDDETMKHKFNQSYYTPDIHGSTSFNSQEINDSFNGFADLIHDIMRDVNINSVVSKLTKFLMGNNTKQLMNNVIINNNLGLTSLPLLFIGYLIGSLSPQNSINEGLRNLNSNSPEELMMNFINLNAGSVSNSNLIFLKYFLKLPKNFVNLLIENFLILIKIFYAFRKNSPQNRQDAEPQAKKHKPDPTAHSPAMLEIINSPILQSIIYLIREMGSNLQNDDFLHEEELNRGNFHIDNVLNVTNDLVLYFYLKNIEIVFITWLNFLNFGNNQLINIPATNDNYLTRLVKYIEISMEELYTTLDISRNPSKAASYTQLHNHFDGNNENNPQHHPGFQSPGFHRPDWNHPASDNVTLPPIIQRQDNNPKDSHQVAKAGSIFNLIHNSKN